MWVGLLDVASARAPYQFIGPVLRGQFSRSIKVENGFGPIAQLHSCACPVKKQLRQVLLTFDCFVELISRLFWFVQPEECTATAVEKVCSVWLKGRQPLEMEESGRPLLGRFACTGWRRFPADLRSGFRRGTL
jgi:hypothetical protein